MLQVLFKQLPLDSLVSSLTSLLARKSFSRTFTQWQEVCLSSVSLLTCKPLLAAPPEMLDDVVLAWIPLLYVDRRGSDFPGRVAEKMGQSHLVKGHPVLEALAGLSSHQGNCDCCVERGKERERTNLKCTVLAELLMYTLGHSHVCVSSTKKEFTKRKGVGL